MEILEIKKIKNSIDKLNSRLDRREKGLQAWSLENIKAKEDKKKIKKIIRGMWNLVKH